MTGTPEPLSGQRSGYIPTLDGWRALAVLAVILFHAKIYRIGPISTVPIAHFGRFGVDIFFGISGLLICTRLLEEERLRGQLHLTGFYIRRILRIQPPSLLMLGAVSLLMLFKVLPAGWQGVLAALTFVRNYLPSHPPQTQAVFTGHFWSLAVEEHFYLLLPAFLYFCKRLRVRVLLAATAIDVAWAIVYAHDKSGFHWDLYSTDRCLYFLIFPAAVAILLQRDRFRSAAERYLRPSAVALISLVLLLFLQIGNPVTALVIVALILSTVLHPQSVMGRLLETPPMRFIGRISFGLYLWQEPFFTARYLGSDFRPFGLLDDAPWNFLATFLFATASYYLLEKPCMRLGHRLARPAVEGRPELAIPGLPRIPAVPLPVYSAVLTLRRNDLAEVPSDTAYSPRADRLLEPGVLPADSLHQPALPVDRNRRLRQVVSPKS